MHVAHGQTIAAEDRIRPRIEMNGEIGGTGLVALVARWDKSVLILSLKDELRDGRHAIAVKALDEIIEGGDSSTKEIEDGNNVTQAMKLRTDALGRDGLGYTFWALVAEEGLGRAFPQTKLTV